MALALVVVDRAVNALDREFTYEIPPSLEDRLTPGQWVWVPLGSGNKPVRGCYVGPADESKPVKFKLKPIDSIMNNIPPVPGDLIQVARWVSDRYVCTFPAALRLLIPAMARTQKVKVLKVNAVRLMVTAEEALVAAAASEKRAAARAKLLRLLADRYPEPILLTDLEEQNPSARGAVASTVKAGLIQQFTVTKRRDPFAGQGVKAHAPFVLTPDQEKVVQRITSVLHTPGPKKPILLHGVTGSGKTEVYIQAISEVVQRGKQAIVLVPEIALTPQLVSRFRSRFGDRMAVLHSALSVGEHFDEWMRIRNGDVDVVIGVRSAIFAPVEHLGMVILDEEHETTYKQAELPSYHARDVAEHRASLNGALLLLGSATPAVETYYRAEQGEITRLEMPVRVRQQAMPTVDIVDMREELKEGNRSIFSRALVKQLDKTLRSGSQAILFLNRRGHSTYVFCRTCGESVQCPSCDIAMTYHMPKSGQTASKWLACHHCGHKEQVPQTCPKCGSRHVRFLGAGTERIETELKELLPDVRAIRMDSDTTQSKGSHQHIIEAFERGEYNVLIGTQMVAKGLDIANVTLVGAILADTTLNIQDMRAPERTFQLLEQAAGRAGRAHLKGHVVFQTYNPEHYAIQCAAKHDYLTFYRQEIAYRRMMGNPPLSELIRLVYSGQNESEVISLAHEVADAVKEFQQDHFELIGPCAAPVARIQGNYRYHMVLKGHDIDAMARVVAETLRPITATWNEEKRKRLKVSVDVDPRQFM